MAKTVRVQAIVEAKDRFSNVLNNFGLSLKSVGVIAAGAFAFQLGKQAVGAAASFETKMQNINTLLGSDSVDAMRTFEDGIKSMTKTIPIDPDELGSAAYQIVSAGIGDASDALVVLRESARLSVGGLGSAEEATDLMTSAMNAFAIGVDESSEVADILFKTVKAGKTTVADLAQSFGMVAPVAAEMGVEFEELQAATAALTTSGLKTSVAQQQIRAALSSLVKPAKEASDLFKELGVTGFKELIERSGGMVAAFQQLKAATEGNEQALAKAAGSVEGLGAILALTGAQGETFTATLANMHSTEDALTEAVDKQTKTFNSQVKMLKNQWQVLMIDVGNVLIPALIVVMKGLSATIDGVSAAFVFMKDAIMQLKNVGEIFTGIGKAISFMNDMVEKAMSNLSNFASQIKGVVGQPFTGISAQSVGQFVGGETAGDQLTGFLRSTGNFLRSTSSAGGGKVQNNNVNVNLDRPVITGGSFDDLAREVGDAFNRQLRSNTNF